jgi:hypothetical protein
MLGLVGRVDEALFLYRFAVGASKSSIERLLADLPYTPFNSTLSHSEIVLMFDRKDS